MYFQPSRIGKNDKGKSDSFKLKNLRYESKTHPVYHQEFTLWCQLFRELRTATKFKKELRIRLIAKKRPMFYKMINLYQDPEYVATTGDSYSRYWKEYLDHKKKKEKLGTQ